MFRRISQKFVYPSLLSKAIFFFSRGATEGQSSGQVKGHMSQRSQICRNILFFVYGVSDICDFFTIVCSNIICVICTGFTSLACDPWPNIRQPSCGATAYLSPKLARKHAGKPGLFYFKDFQGSLSGGGWLSVHSRGWHENSSANVSVFSLRQFYNFVVCKSSRKMAQKLAKFSFTP